MLFNQEKLAILPNTDDSRSEEITARIESSNGQGELYAIYMKLGTSEFPKKLRQGLEKIIADKLVRDKISGGLYTGDFGSNQVVSDMIYDGYKFNQEFQGKYDEAFGQGKWIELTNEIKKNARQ